MEIRNFFINSSNEIYKRNMDLLEDYDLITPLGSPNRMFLKFLNSKNLKIKDDEITADLIEEFGQSIDSINLRLSKTQRQKEIIFNQKKVWINVASDEGFSGTDLVLDHDGITVESTGYGIAYREMLDIDIAEASSFKKRFTIYTSEGEFVFEINEDNALALKEILEDNIDSHTHDEFDDLLELYDLYGEGKISKEEYELRKAMIYVDGQYCTNCGVKLEPDSDFCSNCGFEVER